MVYEALLLFGVVFIVSYAVLALARWTYPLGAQQRWLLQAIVFVAIGLYFTYCWSRSGQTLAMKSWRLRVVDRDGRPPRAVRALLRYLLSWNLLAPGLLFVALVRTHALWALLALAAGLVLMLLLARLGPQHQLLHDRLLGTRVIRD